MLVLALMSLKSSSALPEAPRQHQFLCVRVFAFQLFYLI